jgi:hypothetical protein
MQEYAKALKWQDRFGGERGSSSDGYGVTLPGRRIKRPEIGELFRVGDRSVSQRRRRLRDRLSNDRNAQNLFKTLLGKCNN